MKYYRCKCGHSISYSSMGVARCHICDKCGSTLAESPSGHMEPEPHSIRAVIEDGKILCYCCVCLQRAGTLDEAENADEIRSQISALAGMADKKGGE